MSISITKYTKGKLNLSRELNRHLQQKTEKKIQSEYARLKDTQQ